MDNQKKARILIVDDEEAIRKLLWTRFSREGWELLQAEDGIKALQAAKEWMPTTIVTDIKMPGMDGFKLIEALRSAQVDCPIVMITAHGEKECAIEALHKGAFDYLEKPFDMDEIAIVVKRALEREELRLQNIRLLKELKEANSKLANQLEVKSELLERFEVHEAEELLVGKSSHIQNLKDMIRAISESFHGDNDPVVLITGESGTGKEMVARYMHTITFGKNKPFVAVNCAAFPEQLLESELFGYEKGAFTGAVSRKLGLFELANSGTLFLDEVGEMDLRMQAKLLRVLQERVIRRVGGTADLSVKPHIIAATNRDLAKAVSEKIFREDLYYRLNTIPISVAPLRSRPEDVEELASYFLKKLSVGRVKRFSNFSTSALKALKNYRWPGNVRELRSVVERALVLEKGPMLELSHLRQEHLRVVSNFAGEAATNITGEKIGENMNAALQTDSISSNGNSGVVLNFPKITEKGFAVLRKEIDEQFVRQVLVQSLTQEHGNVSAVARGLRLDRANLLRMLKRFQIEPELFRMKQAS